MPKRNDIHKILIIGSGPIVIGQACEFDYSGTQAIKALREEGFELVLVNSNPATIMTDPEFAHRTYIEPLSTDVLERVIEAERPQALLPTLGGQTALNLAVNLAEEGVLERFHVELIGAGLNAIRKAEDRELFKGAMTRIGLEIPVSGYVRSLQEALKVVEKVGYPVIIRPSFTLGGTGGNIAYNREELEEHVEWGLNTSPVHQVLVEQSVLGWKEYELEVMRDRKDNVVIVCPIENFDPMGIHTGDSITVAPAQTLTDKEYQIMRDAAIAIIREIGVDTGGSNIQFAVEPETGRLVVIEMNPRVSRSSALASKATGFPIAKIAAKLAVGYTLDEIPNDITRETPASFEPTIDYVVVKIPRFTFEKFPEADTTLTTQMKSVGEVMSIGRTFKEALQKAIRSLEIDSNGFEETGVSTSDLRELLRTPGPKRLWYIADALRADISIDEIYNLTRIDRWFLFNINQIIEMENELIALRQEIQRVAEGESKFPEYGLSLLREAKKYGFSDERIGELLGMEGDAMSVRHRAGIEPVFKLVDTCAAEFEAYTPYFYSTYEEPCRGLSADESCPTQKKKIMILGGGPNRIGQGIEFDYCCVHASYALKEEGYETIMVNCNPETVSTDYDTSDRLYFEPLTLEDVLSIVKKERPEGIIVQYGGQTPLKLAVPLSREGAKIIGTSPDSIDIAEDRERFSLLLNDLGLKQAPSGTGRSVEEAEKIAARIEYPVLVRPSYVLGGRAMQIIYDTESLREYMTKAVKASHEHPVLVDKYLEDAIEVDVDALSDGHSVLIGGIMEHIEEAGVHSGDSACVLPPYSLGQDLVEEIRRQTRMLARALNVVGLMNVQYAVKNGEVYVLEVNPRASRTVPFVSKAVGIPFAKVAAKLMVGRSLEELGLFQEVIPSHISVKEAVFPFIKFPGVDTLLGPEMKSTGEVMGIDVSFEKAFAKSQIASGTLLPSSGKAFISVKDKDKPLIVPVASGLREIGFSLVATLGTGKYISAHGVKAELVKKVQEGRPNIVDMIKNGEISLVINTTFGSQAIADSYSIRRTTLMCDVPYYTTISGARAVLGAIKSLKNSSLGVKPLQDYYKVFKNNRSIPLY